MEDGGERMEERGWKMEGSSIFHALSSTLYPLFAVPGYRARATR
jgi:hypothetical protein